MIESFKEEYVFNILFVAIWFGTLSLDELIDKSIILSFYYVNA